MAIYGEQSELRSEIIRLVIQDRQYLSVVGLQTGVNLFWSRLLMAYFKDNVNTYLCLKQYRLELLLEQNNSMFQRFSKIGVCCLVSYHSGNSKQKKVMGGVPCCATNRDSWESKTAKE